MSPEKFLHTKDNRLQSGEDVTDAVEKQDRLHLARKQEILLTKSDIGSYTYAGTGYTNPTLQPVSTVYRTHTTTTATSPQSVLIRIPGTTTTVS